MSTEARWLIRDGQSSLSQLVALTAEGTHEATTDTVRDHTHTPHPVEIHYHQPDTHTAQLELKKKVTMTPLNPNQTATRLVKPADTTYDNGLLIITNMNNKQTSESVKLLGGFCLHFEKMPEVIKTSKQPDVASRMMMMKWCLMLCPQMSLCWHITYY